MDLQARPYRYFVMIAEKGSFSAAARAMYVSQPALSAQIRELERLLGFSLFDRTSRRVQLTAQGLWFLDYARRIILETEFVNRAAQDIRAHPLRIGAAHFTALIPQRIRLIENFGRSHPEVPLSVIGRQHKQLFEDLHTRKLDVAITLEPQIDGETSAVEEHGLRDGIERVSLGCKSLSLLVPSEHPWAEMEMVPYDALRNQEICTISRAHGVLLSETLARLLNTAQTKYITVPEGDAIAAIRYGSLRRCPIVDIGWFPIPADLADGSLVRRPVSGWDLRTKLVMMRGQDARHPALEPFWKSGLQSEFS
jgi:DNA-binding transcriptional LysR family regulator|tara:strand:- start:1904 stop:2830 length:927 start_codon:yes stop_codon:yes gene_type:complete